MKKTFILFVFYIFTCTAHAQDIAIIPQPVTVKATTNGAFALSSQTDIFFNDSALLNSVDFLKTYLGQYCQLFPETIYAKDAGASSSICLKLDKSLQNVNQYQLDVSQKAVTIIAATDTAIFYGVQTLIQLLPATRSSSLIIPAVSVTDYPRVAYRGMHLDVSRHFFDVDFVKKYIDYLAMHKLNYFHWHLTDDHGWRIQIKKYPKLTEIGAWRNGTIIGLYPGTGNDSIRYGGYYTQEQIKEVIDYASKRYITIIPEIEMPAHSMAVLAAYPQFGTNPENRSEVAQTWGMFNKFNNVLQPTEQTFQFMEDVLSEVMDLFPSKYIHIGGDEAAKQWWKASPLSQQIMKENNLEDEAALQSYFIRRIEQFVNSKGKTIIGWNEILQGGLAPNAVVMSWQGEKGGIEAAKQHHKVIMTPSAQMYFNHSQFVKEDSLTAKGTLLLESVYKYDPVPAALSPADATYIWGGQGCLWTEYISNPAKAEYMLFPRLDALSEILWTLPENKNYSDFLNRLKNQFKRYDLMGVNYSKRYLEQE
jgi:hexosaminidase